MKHTSPTEFGRPIEAVLPTQHSTDKWEALNHLTEAAERFDLSHRTLGVLKALMTFLPGRIISPVAGEAIVFPSNRTLCHRLNGMPDSTLRRHLATLVRLGIVSRHDSPNRKRYARSGGQGVGIAFGFDLSPISHHQQHLEDCARKAREAKQALAALRDRLAVLRQRLLIEGGSMELMDKAAIALRRKPNSDVLSTLCDSIERVLECTKMSGSDAQNERHIQYDINSNSDSESKSAKQGIPKKRKALAEPNQHSKNTQDLDLQDVLNNCHEFKTYYPEPVRHWHDLSSISERLTCMMGIEPKVFRQAVLSMGASCAATVILCMLERLEAISNPGGYLRRLTQLADTGRFSVKPMLAALAKEHKLSADNSNNYFFSVC